MTNSAATYTRNIIVDFPDWAGATVYFYLRTYFAAAGSEGFPKKEYALTLDGTGQGTQALPVPDNTGDAAWAWKVKTPDSNNYGGDDSPLTLAYGADLQLTAWLAAAQSGETPASLPDFFVLKTGDTMTGPLDFSGTDHGGIEFISLTTAQRNALTPAVGMVIYNTTDGEFQGYDGAWGSLGGGGGDVSDLTTTGLTPDNFLKIDDPGGLIEITPAGVLSGIGAAAAVHTHSYQPLDAGLTDLAGLDVTDGNIPVGNGTNWVAESGATARSSLGLGTLATQSGTFSGGGTLETASFTLTVPATGTAALLGVSNTFTAQQLFPDGSASAPGISFASDTGVGIRRPAAGQMAFSSGTFDWGAYLSGRFALGGSTYLAWSSLSGATGSADVFLRREAANVLQQGADSAPPADQTFKGPDGSGTNIAGASLTIAAGKGTGAGAGGNLDFQTAPIGASGSSANALVTAGRFDDEPLGGDATRFMLLDLSDGIIKRVVFGADDLAGPGLKPLAVAN